MFLRFHTHLSMHPDQRKYIRSIVRRVHPDLFTAHPFERSKNAESLKQLNSYADLVSQGERPSAVRLEFYIREVSGVFARIDSYLTEEGSLGPLFRAFGLLTEAEVLELESLSKPQWTDGSSGTMNDGRDLYEWLRDVAAEAVKAADDHDSLRTAVREVRSTLEHVYGLYNISIGGEHAVTTAEQKRQLESLEVLRFCFEQLNPQGTTDLFEGLTIRLYHPDACPLDTYRFTDENGNLNLKTRLMRSHVADDGVLHIVADRDVVVKEMKDLDLERAKVLAKLSAYWTRRGADLASALQSMLGVENVWNDAKTAEQAQRFVLWAGAVLAESIAFEYALKGLEYSFSVLVHSDENAAMVDFLPTSSVLQVRCDCPPARLLEFLCSDACLAADASAAVLADAKQREESLLDAVKEALGAKNVIRLCSSYDSDKVADAARRLLVAAPLLKGSLDMSSVSLAIDDCYEVWDSGFVSIPHDFVASELKPQLQALLQAPSTHNVNSGKRGNNNGVTRVRATATGGLLSHHGQHTMCTHKRTTPLYTTTTIRQTGLTNRRLFRYI